MSEQLVSLTPPPAAGKWTNPHRRLPAVRWLVQGLYAVFCTLVGVEFALFHAQAVSGGPITASLFAAHRPPR